MSEHPKDQAAAMGCLAVLIGLVGLLLALYSQWVSR